VRLWAGTGNASSTATLLSGRDILFVGGTGTVDAIGGGTNLGVTMVGGGDVQLPASISTTTGNAVIIADAAFKAGDLFGASANPALVGTPLAAASLAQAQAKAGGILNQSLNGTAPLTITTGSGNIGLISGAIQRGNGNTVTIAIGPNVNEVSIASTTGNILIDPPSSIVVDGNLLTAGDITLVAQQNILFTSAGTLVSSNGNVLIVADNQNPTGLKSNVATNGQFVMAAGSKVQAHGRAEIYSADPRSDLFAGTIVGYGGVPNPFFDNSQTLFDVHYVGPAFPYALPYLVPFSASHPLLGQAGPVGVFFKVAQQTFQLNQPFLTLDQIVLPEGFAAGYSGGVTGSLPQGNLAYGSSAQYLEPVIFGMDKIVFLAGSSTTAGSYQNQLDQGFRGGVDTGSACPTDEPNCILGFVNFGNQVLPVTIRTGNDMIWMPKR
jgi:hypothetical protein